MTRFETNHPEINKSGMVENEMDRFEKQYNGFVKEYVNSGISAIAPFFSIQIGFSGTFKRNFHQDRELILNYVNFPSETITQETLRKFYRDKLTHCFLSFSQFNQYILKNDQQSFLKRFLIKTFWIKEDRHFKILNFDVSQVFDPKELEDGHKPYENQSFDLKHQNNVMENNNEVIPSKKRGSNTMNNNSSDAPSFKKSTNMYEMDDDWNANLNLNVLLVDDKPVNLRIIALMLEAASCRVDTANNGLEALENFVPEKHQVILMDIMMPVMDGITSMKELRKKYDKDLPPVIAITANAMRGDKEKYIGEGFDAYIAKPVTMNKLLSELKQLKVINNK